MTIELPESVVAMAEEKAKAAGYPDVAEYVAGLVEADGRAPASSGPLSFSTREELEKLLDEAMEDPVVYTVDAAFWADLRREREERRAARNGDAGR